MANRNGAAFGKELVLQLPDIDGFSVKPASPRKAHLRRRPPGTGGHLLNSAPGASLVDIDHDTAAYLARHKIGGSLDHTREADFGGDDFQ